jgi:hypothetical protein
MNHIRIPILKKIRTYRQLIAKRKKYIYKLHENPSRESDVCWETDWRTGMTRLVVAVCDYCEKVPKNEVILEMGYQKLYSETKGYLKFHFQTKGSLTFTVRPRYAWSSIVRPSNTCSFIVSQTLREDALKRCVNFHSRAKACMKLQSREGIREVSGWDKTVGLHANPRNKGMCEVPLPDQRMREIALRDQGMREVERISEVSLWDKGAREVSLSDEATVKFDSEIQKDVNIKKKRW